MQACMPCRHFYLELRLNLKPEAPQFLAVSRVHAEYMPDSGQIQCVTAYTLCAMLMAYLMA